MSQPLPIVLPENKILRFFLRPFYSFVNFFKASILSLLIIGIILGLTSEMDQAKTMLVAMIEPSGSELFAQRFSLFICLITISILAVGLSHFPIYIYYAGNLNNSRNHIFFIKEAPYSKGPFSWIRVFTYRLKETINKNSIHKSTYMKDWLANTLRNFLGLGIFSVWMWFIFWTFEPQFTFYNYTVSSTFSKWFSIVLGFIPYLTFFVFRIQFRPNPDKVELRKKLYGWVGRAHTVFLILCICLTIYSVFFITFSQLGYFILTITCFATSMSFVFYRLARPRIFHVLRKLKKEGKKRQSIAYYCNGLILKYSCAEKYLGLFVISFIIACIFVLYFTVASFYDFPLPNSLTIVFVFLYFYFYLFSIVFKYYFVKYSIARREYQETKSTISLSTPTFKLLTSLLICFGLLQIFSLFSGFEKNENSLSPIHSDFNQQVKLTSFLDAKNDLLTKNESDTLYFIVSQGGGLKGNLWTLNVLNELNEKSKNKIFQNTIALSGASGGSMGLSLYSDIFSSVSPSNIAKTIDKIGETDYVSRDVAMLFGIDLARSTFPWSLWKTPQDRSYYNMLEYINIIHNKNEPTIPNIPFQYYWANIFKESNNQLPMLIVNTSCTDGKRGIFCSVSDTDTFKHIFKFAHNLNQFNNHQGEKKSISFYEAVSTTNRFPLVSPAAKIEGVGHFIDAGAIDNSGILSAWDMYQYLNHNLDSKIFKDRVTVFVEITNGKTNFINKVMKEFNKTHHFETITNEFETSSIVANISTGMSLSKIPGYLHEFLEKQDETREDFVHREICLPQKISIEDVEEVYFKGEILNEKHRNSIIEFLQVINQKIVEETHDENIGFSENWNCYEPALSRHMSQSNLRYFESQKENIYLQFLGDRYYFESQ